MKETTKTFKRHELKYFVTPSQYETLYRELSVRMVPDVYCKDGSSYMIYNLYFDTMDDAVIRQSLSKPYYKEKLRLRSYGLPETGNEPVFLELKKKVGGIVVKRRAVIPYWKALAFVDTGQMPAPEADDQKISYEDHQVLREIQDFLERYQGMLTPKVFISYERVAFFDKIDEEFRVSFDQGILTRRRDVDLLDGNYGINLLPEGNYLMEVKCVGAMPFWFCRLLSELQIYVTSFSKYGTEYKNQVS